LCKSFVAIQLDLDSCLHFIKGEDNPQSEVALGTQDGLWFSVSNFTHFKATSKPWIMCPLRIKDALEKHKRDQCHLLPQIA
jgi:hypothetical protein